jgi:hypothetical protein
MITRADLQTLTTKLDLNHVTLAEAKRYCARIGAPVAGRAKAEFIHNLAQAAKASEGAKP